MNVKKPAAQRPLEAPHYPDLPAAPGAIKMTDDI